MSKVTQEIFTHALILPRNIKHLSWAFHCCKYWEFSIKHTFYYKCSIFNKNFETCKEAQMYGSCTGRKAVHKNCPWETPGIRFTNEDFKSTIINMFEELRKIIFEEIKENMRMSK